MQCTGKVWALSLGALTRQILMREMHNLDLYLVLQFAQFECVNPGPQPQGGIRGQWPQIFCDPPTLLRLEKFVLNL